MGNSGDTGGGSGVRVDVAGIILGVVGIVVGVSVAGTGLRVGASGDAVQEIRSIRINAEPIIRGDSLFHIITSSLAISIMLKGRLSQPAAIGLTWLSILVQHLLQKQRPKSL